MSRFRNPRVLPIFLPALLAATLFSGCAVKRDVRGDPVTGVMLSYRFPEERALRYETTIEQSQKMEVRGQSRSFGYDRTIDFSVRAEGANEEGQPLEVTIEALTLRMAGPRGEGRREIQQVKGKSFDLVLSATGEESSLAGAGAIRFELPSGALQSVEPDFLALFPDLPTTPVVVGDTWTSVERIVDEALGSPAPIELHLVHTVEGFEVVDGMNCVKIRSTMNADVERTGETPDDASQQNLPFAGRIVGTATWQFAYDEGILVRNSVTRRAAGTLSTGAINPLPRRLTHQTTIETRLVR